MEKNLQKKKLKLFCIIKYISLYCLKKKHKVRASVKYDAITYLYMLSGIWLLSISYCAYGEETEMPLV